jgi:hypothetical protein
VVAEILSVHRALHVVLSSTHSKILVVNIADVTNRVVVVMMIVL